MRINLNQNLQIESPDEKSLLVDLSPHGEQILRGSQVQLWLPLSWLTKSSHFKRRKNFLLRNSNLIGDRGKRVLIIPTVYLLPSTARWMAWSRCHSTFKKIDPERSNLP